MINPLAPVFEWWLQFLTVLPPPAISFLSLLLVLFLVSSALRWFLR